MIYDELTTEQKAILQADSSMLRAWCGEQARTNNHGEAIDGSYNAQTSAILASLDAGEVVPNASGLAGAASLTKEDLTGIVSHIQGVQSGYNTVAHRAMWTRAAGAGNMIG